MTSREFYQTVDRVLSATLERHGFSRLKVTSSAWVKPLREKNVLFQIEKGVKRPYIKPIGGQFNVCLHLVTKATLSEAHSETSISFLRYYTDNDLTEMKQIRRIILQRILSQTEFESEFDKSLLEMNKPVMELSLDHNFNRRQPWPLEYLNTEDVFTWAKFVGARVPAAYDGVSEEGDSALSFK